MPNAEPYLLSDEELRRGLFGTNAKVRDQFDAHFEQKLQLFLDNSQTVCTSFRTFASSVSKDRRAAWCEFFMYGAFDFAFTSCHLLITGMMIPAGQLMRLYGESCAMALLCSHHAIDVLDRLESNPRGFPIDDAVRLVHRKRNTELLDVDRDGWQTFKQITEWYDRYSHATVFALQTQLMVSSPEIHVLVSEFDEEKLEIYRKEITLRVSAMNRLCDLTAAVTRHVATAIAARAR
jgi:hypothetical protein